MVWYRLIWATLYVDAPKLTFGKCIQRLTKHKEKYGKYVDTVMTGSPLARLPLLYHRIKLHPAAVLLPLIGTLATSIL